MSKSIEGRYSQTVSEIRDLISNWFESGVDLFLKLRDVDRDGVWKLPGHATFADFLRAEFPTMLGVERYQNVINAIEMYGVERVKQVGVESCHAMTVKALAEDASKRTQLLAGIDNFVKKNGCAPDRNKVRELVAGVAPETRKLPKELRDIGESNQLRVELSEARKRIRELESEVKRLQRENAKLTGGTRKAPARKGSAKAA